MRDLLERGLDALAIEADQGQLDLLLHYLALLQKWNRAYNLTAITQPSRMVSHHLLDSLSILRFIPRRGVCLDVGTGGGLPGIPLAMLLPGACWVLLDSNGKKTRFVQQVIAECALDHVKVVQSRVEDYHAASDFDVIVSRAYASLQGFAASVDHLWQPATRLISMKTELGEAEMAELRSLDADVDIQRLNVPGIESPRSVVNLKRLTK